jgi:superoxide reductase
MLRGCGVTSGEHSRQSPSESSEDVCVVVFKRRIGKGMMAMLGERIQHADWKKEKHVPVIECPDKVKVDEFFGVKVSLGKEIAHPNTTEHHIRWITLYFHPEGDKFTYDVAHFEFNAHGEAVAGPNEGPVHTHHEASTSMKITKPGTLHALALCNIHGLWESTKEIGLL